MFVIKYSLTNQLKQITKEEQLLHEKLIFIVLKLMRSMLNKN